MNDIRSSSKKDFLWGTVAQILNIGSGLILLPFALHFLSSSEVGLWYVFIMLAGLSQLLEFGFQPTISRFTSYVYSGADEIFSRGLPSTNRGDVNLLLLYTLIQASKTLYRYTAIVAAIFLVGGGGYYIYSLGVEDANIYMSWSVYACSLVIGFYFSYFNGLLQGRGNQTTLNIILALSKLVLICVTIPMLSMGFGLFSLAIGSMFSIVFARIFIFKVFWEEPLLSKINESPSPKEIKEFFGVLLSSSWRLGLTRVGSFAISRTNFFIATSYLGLAVGASYGLSLQLLGVITTVSSMLFNLNMPKMNSLQSKGKKKELRAIFYPSMLIAIALCIVGLFFLIFVCPLVLSYLGKGNVSLLPVPILILLGGVFLLELHHSLCATYLTTLNRIPFVPASLISGVLITLFGLIGVSIYNTVLVLVLSQGLIQLIYNNWYWPWLAYRHVATDKSI